MTRKRKHRPENQERKMSERDERRETSRISEKTERKETLESRGRVVSEIN